MKTLPVIRVHLRFSVALKTPPRPHLLRGAVAALFPEEDLLHQHGRNGFIYRYPLVQYRWLDGNGILVGFLEGAHLLAQLPWLEKELRLGETLATITDVKMHFSNEEVRISDRLIRYRFVTPWLSLSQENHETYKALDRLQQERERDRIAVGNLLTAFRGLGIEVGERLFAAFQIQRKVPCRYKDQTLLGFLGTLITNVEIPDDMAIGRAVSHGYGWVKRADSNTVRGCARKGEEMSALQTQVSDWERLKKISEGLKSNCGAQKVILFGSAARGAIAEAGDIDLLVVSETTEGFLLRAASVLAAVRNLSRGMPLSPIVLTPKELNERLEHGDQFIQEILASGVEL